MSTNLLIDDHLIIKARELGRHKKKGCRDSGAERVYPAYGTEKSYEAFW